MSNKKPRTVYYQRKKSGKTNYRKRLSLLLAKKPRLVIRSTNQKIIAQIINFTPQGDRVLVGVDSNKLKKYGWGFSLKNLPATYLTGYLLGKMALTKKVNEAILDIGFRLPIKGNKSYVCLKGVVDAGLKVAHSKDIFPSEDRIMGKHIEEYVKKMQNNSPNKKVFSKYLKTNINPLKISEQFQKVKK